MKVKHFTIPVFLPEMACPFRCIYCNQSRISGIKKIPSDIDVIHKIESYLKTFPKKDENIIEVGFFGGNFTGLSIKEQESYLISVQNYIQQGYIKSIRISTRPDYITSENLVLLKKYKVSTIELGAQSLNDEVLSICSRGHNFSDIQNASLMIKELGFRLGLQMMIGLPGDNEIKCIETVNKIISLHADDTRIYPTLVIKDTFLEQLFLKGDYKPLSIDESINILKRIIPLFESADINIIRIGLHPSEDLLNGNGFLAGPFHPSLRELAETEIWNDLLFSKITIYHNKKNVEIFVSANHFNFAIGYKSKNKNNLKIFFENVKFYIDNNLINRQFYVNYY